MNAFEQGFFDKLAELREDLRKARKIKAPKPRAKRLLYDRAAIKGDKAQSKVMKTRVARQKSRTKRPSPPTILGVRG